VPEPHPGQQVRPGHVPPVRPTAPSPPPPTSAGLTGDRQPRGEWPVSGPPIGEIRTIAHVMPVHAEVLLDEGIDVPGYVRPAPRFPALPWHRRLRLRAQGAVWSARRRLADRIYPCDD
jgi:hypothetical protein